MADTTDIIYILMATYNGEAYIEPQIESILSQTYKNWILHIHDDGSSDNTRNIIKQYVQQFPGKINLYTLPVNLGAKDSFLWMLENSEAKYYMFCDQDDVWLPTKIEDTYNRMKEIEHQNLGKAVMIHTDLTIVDKNLNQIYKSFWNWGRFNVDLNKHFRYCPIGNVFTGCTMMINRRAKDFIFPVSRYAKMHDEWIGLVVSKNGIVENLKKQTILYRQHGKNVCSIGNKKRFVLNIKTIKKLFGWYYEKKELLDELNYGNVWYASFNKIKYDLIRIFKISR